MEEHEYTIEKMQDPHFPREVHLRHLQRTLYQACKENQSAGWSTGDNFSQTGNLIARALAKTCHEYRNQFCFQIEEESGQGGAFDEPRTILVDGSPCGSVDFKETEEDTWCLDIIYTNQYGTRFREIVHVHGKKWEKGVIRWCLDKEGFFACTQYPHSEILRRHIFWTMQINTAELLEVAERIHDKKMPKEYLRKRNQDMRKAMKKKDLDISDFQIDLEDLNGVAVVIRDTLGKPRVDLPDKKIQQAFRSFLVRLENVKESLSRLEDLRKSQGE